MFLLTLMALHFPLTVGLRIPMTLYWFSVTVTSLFRVFCTLSRHRHYIYEALGFLVARETLHYGPGVTGGITGPAAVWFEIPVAVGLQLTLHPCLGSRYSMLELLSNRNTFLRQIQQEM